MVYADAYSCKIVAGTFKVGIAKTDVDTVRSVLTAKGVRV